MRHEHEADERTKLKDTGRTEERKAIVDYLRRVATKFHPADARALELAATSIAAGAHLAPVPSSTEQGK